MRKLITKYEGSMSALPPDKIVLNVHDLRSGSYHLQIVHNRKIIKTITFKK